MFLINALTIATRTLADQDRGVEPDSKDYGRLVTAYHTLEESGVEEYFDLAQRMRDDLGYIITRYDRDGGFDGEVG